MIRLCCTVCRTELETKFSYSVSFGVFVKLPLGWQIKTDAQQVFCSLACAEVNHDPTQHRPDLQYPL